MALLKAASHLRSYFQIHRVVVRTDHPVAKILRKPDLIGRIVAWLVELSEFGLRFKPHDVVRNQHLADFTAELSLVEEVPLTALAVMR